MPASYYASYSPVDRKLRFRFDRDITAAVYCRLHRAGFKWNTREDLFIAPCTKKRAAALLELVPTITTLQAPRPPDPAIAALHDLLIEKNTVDGISLPY